MAKDPVAAKTTLDRYSPAHGLAVRSRQARVEFPVGGNFAALRLAAERGLGIARLPGLIVHEAIRAGRLVSLLDAHAPPPTPLHVVHVGGRHLPPRTRAFLDFVEPRFAQALARATAA